MKSQVTKTLLLSTAICSICLLGLGCKSEPAPTPPAGDAGTTQKLPDGQELHQ